MDQLNFLIKSLKNDLKTSKNESDFYKKILSYSSELVSYNSSTDKQLKRISNLITITTNLYALCSKDPFFLKGMEPVLILY